MSPTTNLQSYLTQCCEKYDFLGCVIAGDDGLLLAASGESIDDEFTAHLPNWLASGNHICQLGNLGNMACCCVLPRNKAALMLAWSIENDTETPLYFAALTKSIPKQTVTTLNTISNQALHLLQPLEKQ